MPLPKEHRQRIRKSLDWTGALALAIFLFVGPAGHSLAQLPKPAAAPLEKAEPRDPLGRESPRSAFLGLLKYGESGDATIVARYLQPSRDGDTTLVERVRQLQALHSKFHGDIALLTDDPNGIVEAGLPPGQVRAGVFEVGGTTVDVILVRVDDPAAGNIWLISRETVAKVPQLYAQMKSEGPTAADRFIPAALTSHRVLSMSLAQWLVWLLSIPVAWFLAWLLEFLLSAPHRVWCKLRKLPFKSVWTTPLGVPLRCIVAILVHTSFVYLLGPPLLYRVYYFRFLAALLAGCFAWVVSRIVDRGFEHVVNRTRSQRAGGESILIIMQRLTRIALMVVAFVAALAIFGINVETTLAGLGIGGLAVALGAQKSLENLVGGVSLLMDKAVHVGDFCQIGGRLGTVEDIGLRSLKLRELDQSLLVVPNGALAQMQFENMKSRRKLLMNQTFSLRIETRAEQLRLVLKRVQGMLEELPTVESGSSRIRVNKFDGAAFELELFAYGNTSDWMEFTTLRQDVVIKIAEIVEACGSQFAGPTQLNYVGGDPAVELEKNKW
jgi:MscS family membrane protein